MGMNSMRLLWWSVYGLFTAATLGQTVGGDLISEISPWANLGAVGILGYLVKLMLGEIRDQRKDAKEVSEKHSTAMAGVSETLREITRSCALTQARQQRDVAARENV